MAICVVSTVGSSVFSNASNVIRDKARELSKLKDIDLRAVRTAARNFPGHDIYLDMLAELKAKHDEASVRRASAELNSISRIVQETQRNTNDSLVFLATETPDGVLAARILADFCTEYFERDTDVQIIEGLQVKDGALLRRTGLRNLIQALYASIAGKHPGTYDRVFNPTGGFKAFVPYMTLIAMVEPAIRVTYIFDQSDELISLTRLPINLDFSRLEPIVPALVDAASKTLTEAELRTLLSVGDGNLAEHDAWSLFEAIESQGETYYSVNGLGQIVVSHFAHQLRTPVWLSRQAYQRLNRTSDGSEEKQNYLKILGAIHDPNLRESNHHLYPNGAGATVYKLGRQKERAFYLDNDDHVLVLEFARHINETSYDVAPQDRSQYDKHHRWNPE